MCHSRCWPCCPARAPFQPRSWERSTSALWEIVWLDVTFSKWMKPQTRSGASSKFFNVLNIDLAFTEIQIFQDTFPSSGVPSNSAALKSSLACMIPVNPFKSVWWQPRSIVHEPISVDGVLHQFAGPRSMTTGIVSVSTCNSGADRDESNGKL